MCGILAVFGEGAEDCRAEAEAAARKLEHRGPDERGSELVGACLLCHERLSIVDLSGGRQPLTEGKWRGIVNGEIYNHAELREGLPPLGTSSDSHAVLGLAAYSDEEPSAWVGRLRGMFAFVATDGDVLLAGRDPLGIKPLYYGTDSAGRLWLASEMKSMLSTVEFREFPAGHVMRVTPGGSPDFRPFFTPEWPGEAKCTKEELLSALTKAVTRRLMADVPVGCFLSGGLDSSAISAIAHANLPGELHTFVIGTEDSPDIPASIEVAEKIGSIHHIVELSPSLALEQLRDVVYYAETFDPSLIISLIPNYLLAKEAKKHVKVVLCGEGADEAFGGYVHFGSAPSEAAFRAETERQMRILHNIVLKRLDRATMAHGLEARVPFLDVDFLDLVMRLEGKTWKAEAGEMEKRMLRDAVADLIPASVTERKKMIFGEGVGRDWKTAVLDHCEAQVTDEAFSLRAERFPCKTPGSKAEYYFRGVFDELFDAHPSAVACTDRWEDACETAVDWFHDGYMT